MLHAKRKEESLKRVRVSSQQVQSMKDSNEISCQGNAMIIISKECFFPYFFSMALSS